MKKVFIVHGFGGRPNSGWRVWLMAELGKLGYYACSLALPCPDKPIKEQWVDVISRNVEQCADDDEVFLVGHSLGVAAILRFLEQWEGEKPIAGIVLVAGPSEPTSNELVKNFLDDSFDYDKIRGKIGSCVVIHGDSDNIVPPSHAEAHARGLQAPLVMVEGAGHFNSSSGCHALPECLEALLHMLQ